jgi:protein TonB
MVNAARADVGAAAEPAYNPPPQPRRAPPPPPPATPAPSLSFTRPGHDPLSNEAEHWRAIRDSRNPSDFMDYLARFGPEGAFAEVAELRLKQLTSTQQPEARAPARPAPPPPAPQRPLTPRVAMPPTRTEAPRRLDPPPPPRRPEPARRPPPPERSYDRVDLHEPPRREGGPLRAFILVALLGGAALAGGLYVGGEAQQSDTVAAPSDTEGDVFAGEPNGAPDPLSLDEAATSAPARRAEAPPPRRETPAPTREARREEPAPETATPAPVTSWAANNATPNSGPVSLSPRTGAPPPATTSSPVPLSPPSQAPVTQPASTPPQQAARPPAAPATVTWAQRPSSRRISDLYPDRAMRDGVGGRVELSCRVLTDPSLNCGVASESPSGMGFGRAAIAAASSYRANPTRSDGSPAANSTTRIGVQFRAPE